MAAKTKGLRKFRSPRKPELKSYGRSRVEIIDEQYRRAGAHVSGGRHAEQFIVNRPKPASKEHPHGRD